MKRIYKSLLFISIGVYIGYGLLIYIRQDKMIYFPNFGEGELLKCAEVNNGVAINSENVKGVLYPKSTSSIIVIYHGNATNACERNLYKVALYNNPASILIVSYPGYLSDKSSPNNKTIIEQVESVNKWIKENGYTINGIVGESIGVGPASYHSYISPSPLALIAPYPSLSKVAQNILWMYPVSMFIKNDYDVETWVKSAPRILLIAGSSDEIMTPKIATELYNSLPVNQVKKIIWLKDLDHTGILNSDDMAKAVASFFE